MRARPPLLVLRPRPRRCPRPPMPPRRQVPRGLARRRRRRAAERARLTPPRRASGTGWRAAAPRPCATAFYWNSIQPTGPGDARLRRHRRARARRGPARARRAAGVQGTPDVGGAEPGRPGSPPRDTADFARLLTALVARYGPNGSLWVEHPEVVKQPIRAWQIWNEPNLTRYWNVAPWAPSYVALLKAAHRGAEGRRPGLEDDPRRAPERELEGAAGDLRRRRPRGTSTSSRCTRTPASRRTWCGS